MRWDEIIPAWIDRIESNDDVASVLGDPPALYMAGEREHEVPSLEWTLLTPGLEGEIWEVCLIQTDLFTRSMDDLRTLSSGLRAAAHHDLRITVGGHEIWSRLDAARTLQGAQDGIHNVSYDFRLEFLRSKYA